MANCQPVIGLFLAVSMLGLLAGCHGGDDAADTSSAAPSAQKPAPSDTTSGRTLTYYIDQKKELSEGGVNTKDSYFADLAACKRAPPQAMKLLKPDQVAKLRVKRKQEWHTKGKEAIKVTKWKPVPVPGASILKGTGCQYLGIKKVSHLKLFFPNKIYDINLTSGKGGVYPTQQPADSAARKPVTEAKQKIDVHLAKQQGIKQGGTRSVAGHECVMWTYGKEVGLIKSAQYRTCFWSKGRKWGYPASPGGLALLRESLDGSFKIVTTNFVVGRLPKGGKIFHVPGDVTIKDHILHDGSGNKP